MENQFVEEVEEFFQQQTDSVRLGILQYYVYEPPDGMYLFWNAKTDDRLSDTAKKAALELDAFFLSRRNSYVSFELAHRQVSKHFKRKYLNRNVSMASNGRTRALST